MASLLALTLVAALASGCEDDAATPAAAASAPSSAAPAFDDLPLAATWKGQPLKLASALAFSRGGSSLQVTLSTHPLSCADMRRGVQRHPGEVNVDLTFAPRLTRDGKERWSITRARFGEVTRQGDLGPVDLSTYNPKETVRSELDVTLPFPPDELTLKGEVEIEGCGLLPRSKDARVLRQEHLKVSLAGKTMVINGATLETKRSGQRVLQLSTEPLACTETVASDATISIVLPPDGEGTVPSAVRAEGYVLPRVLATKPTEGAIAVTPKKTGGGGGPPSVADQARFDVTADLTLGGYALHVEGPVTAQVCPG